MNEESIIKKILSMTREAIALKGQQRVAAHDLVVNDTTFTKSYTIGGYQSIWVTITFTADKQNNPFAELNYEINGDSYDDYFETYTKLPISDSKAVVFRVNLTNFTSSSAVTRTITWHVLSTDEGVIAA